MSVTFHYSTANRSRTRTRHFQHRSGQALAGHLDRATVFAGELYVREFDDKLIREHDDATDLDLWL